MMLVRRAALPTLIACTLLLSACGQAASPPPAPSQVPKPLAVRPAAQTPELETVTMLSPTVALTGGLGVILRTANGGRSWVPVSYPAGNVTSFDRLSATIVFAVTSRALYRSTDAGQNWKLVNASDRLAEVDFLTPQRGFAVPAGPYGNATGNLLMTTDGGAVWSAVSPPFVSTSVCFTSASQGFALGQPPSGANATAAGHLHVTSDGGKSWQRLGGLPGNWVAGQLYCGTSGVWLELYGQGGMSQASYDIFHSSNDGQTWQAVAADITADGPPPGNPLNVARAPGSSPGPAAVAGSSGLAVLGSCEACGEGGTVFFGATVDGGKTFTASTVPLEQLSDMSLIGINFVNATDGMIVSHPRAGLSVVLVTQNGGQSWQTAARLVSPNPLSGISFVSPKVGFGQGTAGDPRAVLRTTDSGLVWHQVGNLPSASSAGSQPIVAFVGPLSLAFLSSSTGFGVDGNGHLVETHNGGQDWYPVAGLAHAGQVAALSFASPKDGCASVFSTATVLWATTDGGAQWTELAQNSQLVSFALGFGYPMVACAAALANPAFESGLPPLPQGTEGMMVAAPGASEALLLAYTGAASAPNGALLRAAPGQAAWSTTPLPNGRFNPYAFSFVSVSDGYMTTVGGRLFKTTTGGRSWVELP